jgi:2-oxo-4-hydroxy-4-carboxy-5-ureidoimidazoline decarboxylase
MHLGEFNQLPAERAGAAVDPCLGVSRWVDAVVDGRPYDDVGSLLARASESAQQLSDDELESALARHPRIGERPGWVSVPRDDEASFSRREQSGVDGSDDDLADRLRRANQEYEARFGRVFLIRAAGRSGEEILAEVQRRMGNDDEAERAEVVAQLREIALLRLEEVVTT